MHWYRLSALCLSLHWAYWHNGATLERFVPLAAATACFAYGRRDRTAMKCFTLALVVALTVFVQPRSETRACAIERHLQGGTRSRGAVQVQGVVREAATRSHGGMRVVLDTGGPDCGRLLLHVRNPARRWRVGEVVAFRAYLRRIVNFGNPAEFDFAAWNLRRGRRVSAYLWTDDAVQLLAEGSGPAARMSAFRARVIAAALAGQGQERALLAALVAGDRSALNRQTVEGFRRSGQAHLLAISGMHVGMVAGAVLWGLRTLLLRFPRYAAAHDLLRPAALGAVPFVAAYAALSGGGVSIARAAITGLAGLAWVWHGGRADAGRMLAAAACLQACALPGVVCEAGFQLSYAAVAALLIFGSTVALPRGRSAAAKLIQMPAYALAAGAVAWYATAPLALQHFGYVFPPAPVVGLPALALMVPVLSLGLLGAAAVDLWPSAAIACFDLAAWSASWLLALVRAAAGFADVALLQLPAIGWAPVVLWWALPLAYRRYRLRGLAPVLLCLLFVGAGAVHARYRSDRLDAVFVSVGQGDATLLKLPGGRTVLVDAGAPGRGRLAVLPLLHRLGIRRIDVLVLTHAQSDHYGGAAEIMEAVAVGALWLPRADCTHAGLLGLVERGESDGTVVHRVGAGSQGLQGGLGANAWRLEVIAPLDGSSDCSDNDASVVLRASFAGRSILLTGDAESPAERALLAEGGDLQADVLKAGHHGSGTSSSRAFVDAVAPSRAVASLGLENRYGFPHSSVVTRFESRSVRFYRTDLDGAVAVALTARGIEVRTGKPR